MEDVIGDGGQLRSFEAVFSPLGPDGRPRRLWDRNTGAIDPEVAHAWEAYDIRLVLERNWPTLGPKLAGKLHVFTGALDTFYLEGAVRLLKAVARRPRRATRSSRSSRARTTARSSTRRLAARLDREMKAALGVRNTPASRRDRDTESRGL